MDERPGTAMSAYLKSMVAYWWECSSHNKDTFWYLLFVIVGDRLHSSESGGLAAFSFKIWIGCIWCKTIYKISWFRYSLCFSARNPRDSWLNEWKHMFSLNLDKSLLLLVCFHKSLHWATSSCVGSCRSSSWLDGRELLPVRDDRNPRPPCVGRVVYVFAIIRSSISKLFLL